ncbi:MAG TPA: pyridoxal-phosphate dependent enzyme [Chitinophagaceae bacterium]|nr:MAG: cystathionine beta-synthase [Bacteroidetes bacterium OLB11]HMN33564.1 pyridoxal-phosphate dependent enzyme [Chitinophagaceae bacterium]
MKRVYNNIVEAIGNTPLIKLNSITKDFPCPVYVKVEYFNPGNSVKDRIALKLIEDAEKAGKLKPGGTIVECTSGNTGMGLALVAIAKGYKCVFTLADKMSKEKVDILRAMGAEVFVCPTDVTPEDPRSYYSVAARIAKERDGWNPDQYNNLSNRQAHYLSTGPEIWEQTEGKVTHYLASTGTGGTLVGTGMFLKEKNPNIQIVGIDPEGSILKHWFDTNELKPELAKVYALEGMGEDFLPENYDRKYISQMVTVQDKESFLMCRRLAREEGIFCGSSSGAAVQGLVQMKDQFTSNDFIVVVLHDHGSRYVGKIYNDEWMKEKGWL